MTEEIINNLPAIEQWPAHSHLIVAEHPAAVDNCAALAGLFRERRHVCHQPG